MFNVYNRLIFKQCKFARDILRVWQEKNKAIEVLAWL